MIFLTNHLQPSSGNNGVSANGFEPDFFSAHEIAKRDTYWMRLALAQAKYAKAIGEVPVGAVLVALSHDQQATSFTPYSFSSNQVLAATHNKPILEHDPCAHAEILAIRQAAQKIANYRLLHTCLYVTLEPCAMCAGAIVHARLSRVVFAANDPKSGACGSVLNILGHPQLNHHPHISKGILADESAVLLKTFFAKRRKSKT